MVEDRPILCDCLVCPCGVFVARQGQRCPECARDNHCDWKTGARRSRPR